MIVALTTKTIAKLCITMEMSDCRHLREERVHPKVMTVGLNECENINLCEYTYTLY